MLIMVFDTETTGLPGKYISPETLNEWPEIVQLSYIIFDTEKNDIVKTNDNIINIHKEVNPDSIKIHGITTEISLTKGIPVEIPIEQFFNDLKKVDLLVGHNLSFDMDMIRVELMRLIHFNVLKQNEDLDMYYDKLVKYYKNDLHYLNNFKNTYCTMKTTIDLCKIVVINKKGNPYFKFPKLNELHEKLFQTKPENLHNSLNDIVVTLRCYYKLTKDVDLFITNEYVRNFYANILV